MALRQSLVQLLCVLLLCPTAVVLAEETINDDDIGEILDQLNRIRAAEEADEVVPGHWKDASDDAGSLHGQAAKRGTTFRWGKRQSGVFRWGKRPSGVFRWGKRSSGVFRWGKRNGVFRWGKRSSALDSNDA